jgi:hypothetical protein
MIDLMDLVRIGVYARLLVRQHRAIFPGLFEEFVDHFHEFVCHPISLIMFYLLLETERFCCTLEVGRYNVPSNPSVGNLI